ncbi:unnamed protein product [Wuchereria bancrofti]|uniref:Uncharacterized protein n=1 Tax=Wuchereria bancrofti TaxID=6293 RepID=A0A3P7E2D6_WUCBA|nr:unnamed protein product [Wuchereria bancrofti]
MDYLARILCDVDEIQVSYQYQTGFFFLLTYKMAKYYGEIVS